MKYWVNISKNIYHMTAFDSLSDARAAAVKWLQANTKKDVPHVRIFTAEYGKVPYGEVYRPHHRSISSPKYLWNVHDSLSDIYYPILPNGDLVKPGIKKRIVHRYRDGKWVTIEDNNFKDW